MSGNMARFMSKDEPINNLLEKATSRLPNDSSLGWFATGTLDGKLRFLKFTMLTYNGSMTANRRGAVLFNSSLTQCSRRAASMSHNYSFDFLVK